MNFINPLATYNSNPFTPAGTSSTTGLFGDAQRRARLGCHQFVYGLALFFGLCQKDAVAKDRLKGRVDELGTTALVLRLDLIKCFTNATVDIRHGDLFVANGGQHFRLGSG